MLNVNKIAREISTAPKIESIAPLVRYAAVTGVLAKSVPERLNAALELEIPYPKRISPTANKRKIQNFWAKDILLAIKIYRF